MITEDFVSFETAKLLKEKGFDDSFVPVNYGFNVYEPIHGRLIHNNPSGSIKAPTIQMAMKWLREVHKLVIEPYRTACGYLYTISSVPYGSNKYDNSQAFNGDDENSGQWTTWEKACEDGIKYCLENLI